MSETGTIVVLTGDGLEHKYVTNLICAHLPVSAIFVLDAPAPRLSRIFRRGVSAFLDKLLWRAFLLAVNDKKARTAALHDVLGEECREFAEPHKVIKFAGRETEMLARAVKEFRPRVIAVYGTGKIPDAVLKTAGQIALNMHTGLSPYYRGTACAFWPLVEKRPEQVGATVHECTAAMDGGAIFFSRPAKLYRNDGINAVFARAVKVGAQGYVEVLLAAMAGPLRGQSQDLTIGREYYGYMRGLKAELKARANLARMRRAWAPEVTADR